MTKTTNTIQKQYMIAKAYLEALEAQGKELESKYIKENGIVNADGSVPAYIWCIDDEKVFDKANEEQAKRPEAKELYKKELAAREMLKAAENKLIQYGLSLCPQRERQVLADAAKTNYTARQKIIALTLRLDASTVNTTV